MVRQISQDHQDRYRDHCARIFQWERHWAGLQIWNGQVQTLSGGGGQLWGISRSSSFCWIGINFLFSPRPSIHPSFCSATVQRFNVLKSCLANPSWSSPDITLQHWANRPSLRFSHPSMWHLSIDSPSAWNTHHLIQDFPHFLDCTHNLGNLQIDSYISALHWLYCMRISKRRSLEIRDFKQIPR